MKNFIKLLFAIFAIFLTFGFWYYNDSKGELYDNFSAKIAKAQLASVALSDSEETSPRLAGSGPDLSTLIFVGDIMLSRGVGGKMVKYNDYAFPFRQTAEFLSSADLTIGNLEGPISDKGEDLHNLYSFRADPKSLQGINLAGFDILDINNNHIMDWGIEAFKDTMIRLSDMGISYSGAGLTYEESNSPIIKEINGTKIAFLSFSDLSLNYAQANQSKPGISNFELERIKNEVIFIKESKNADLVVVMFHWGEEYQETSNMRQQNIAHQLIDSGVDLIVGHHPHVAQEIEQYNSGYIAYSLGNFVFDQHFSPETMGGLVLKVVIKDQKIELLEQITAVLSTDYQPFIPSLIYPQEP